MKNFQVNLFHTDYLLPGNNFCIDRGTTVNDITKAITAFASSVGVKNGYNFMQNKLNASIKVEIAPSDIAPYIADNNATDAVDRSNTNFINYAVIFIYEGITPLPANYRSSYFYFVNEVVYKSEKVVELVMTLDVLNTFQYGVDYSLLPSSIVTREHKNRIGSDTWLRTVTVYAEQTTLVSVIMFVPTQLLTANPNYTIHAPSNATITTSGYGITITPTTNNYYITFGIEIQNVKHLLIDKYDEGISPPLCVKSSENMLPYEPEMFLCARSTNEPDPSQFTQLSAVDLFVMPDAPFQFRWLTPIYITAADIQDNTYYFITPDFCGGDTDVYLRRTYTAEGNTIHLPFHFTINSETIKRYVAGAWATTTMSRFFVIYKDLNGTLEVSLYEGYPYSPANRLRVFTEIDRIWLTRYGSIGVYTAGYNMGLMPTSPNAHFTTSTSNLHNISSIKDLNRSDSKLNKILALPFCPLDLDTVSGYRSTKKGDTNNIMVTGDYTFGLYRNYAGILLYDKILESEGVQNPTIRNALTRTIGTIVSDPQIELLFTRTPALTDPRVLTDPKLLHSDFTLYKAVYDNFSVALPLENRRFTPYPQLYVKGSISLSLDSNFAFEILQWTDTEVTYSESDYPGLLLVNRNNEIPIYTSAYLDYIKTGYNYDKKAQNREGMYSIAGIGTSVALMATGAITQNPALAASGIISTVNSMLSTIHSQVNYEEQRNAKLAALQNQAANVKGASDFGVFKEYSGNKLKLVKYTVTNTMRTLLDDLFYYYGYATRETKTPNVTTRKWFNFVQADAQIKKTPNISEDVYKKIVELFKQGVTFFHHNTVGGLDMYDKDRVKENWEVNLLT